MGDGPIEEMDLIQPSRNNEILGHKKHMGG